MTVNALNGFNLANGKWQNQPLKNSLSILVLNLMPNKQITELQFLSGFNDCQRDIQLTFMYPATHHFKGVPKKLVAKNYVNLDQVANQHFDGLIITGAPIETLPFEQVDYWPELLKIIDWAKSHVSEQLYECWAAQAGLYHDFRITKHLLPTKLFGIYQATKVDHESPLARGFSAGGVIRMPQSRHTESSLDEAHLPAGLTVIASSAETGAMILTASEKHTTYVTGHPEYQARTLADEYERDLNKHLPIQLPSNYFKDPLVGEIDYSWRDASTRFYDNWTQLLAIKKVGLSI
ncbi:homoserine O-succinyltransferase [Lentilactobacillus fungorum]|uniref:Homoserine O-acetyltransferase n=1 Tax=Lentilactobacillus fungorum TaxID=2201250 RepID=A0ABQ3W3F1_9LACO|nr:homoserine O-succinyltransferase [Lentilactobacillus fungorum]GHP14614.1 homoserine O-succinyltransferase [Lentilactobacillus fungorum]